MIAVPNRPTKEGLINLYHLQGRTFISSVNGNVSRKENPITPNEGDRWCSELIRNQYNEEYWEVRFDYFIYITNYTFENHPADIATPVAWKLEGYTQLYGRWETLHTVTNSNLPNGKFDTYKTLHNGPYNRFKFSTNHLSEEYEGNYTFCIHKVDFFGTAFKIPKITISYQKSNYKIFIAIFLL